MLSIIFISISTSFLYSAEYDIGDIVSESHQQIEYTFCYGYSSDTELQLAHFNGETNGGQYKIIWIEMAATWWGSCIYTTGQVDEIYNQWQDNPHFVKVTALKDIGSPYSCEDWGELGLPGLPAIIDDGDGTDETDLFNLFHTAQFSAHNHAFINHNMVVYFKTTATDSDEINGVLEEMLNLCVLSGNCTDGSDCISGDSNSDSILNVLDVVTAVNCILHPDECTISAIDCVDMNNDNVLNVLDIIQIVDAILSTD